MFDRGFVFGDVSVSDLRVWWGVDLLVSGLLTVLFAGCFKL